MLENPEMIDADSRDSIRLPKCAQDENSYRGNDEMLQQNNENLTASIVQFGSKDNFIAPNSVVHRSNQNDFSRKSIAHFSASVPSFALKDKSCNESPSITRSRSFSELSSTSSNQLLIASKNSNLSPDQMSTCDTKELRKTKSAECMKIKYSFTFAPPMGTEFALALEENKNKSLKLRKGKLRSLKLRSSKDYTASRLTSPITEKEVKYGLTYCMIVGIRESILNQQVTNSHTKISAKRKISNLNMNEDINIFAVSDAEFKTINKVRFPAKGSENMPKLELNHSFKFSNYSPDIFRRLRAMFKIREEDYMCSICGTNSFIDFTTNSKSGQFFYFSQDGKYMIKSQSIAETRFLRKLLPAYYEYLRRNPDSLLVRFCGLHRVKAPHLRKATYFIVMCSVYSSASRRKITNVYDLKGSTKGRIAKRHEEILKDQDVLLNEQKLHLGKLRDGFLMQLKKDTDFLQTHRIMDYSLLIGIHNKLQMQDNFGKALDIKSGKFKHLDEGFALNIKEKSDSVEKSKSDPHETIDKAIPGTTEIDIDGHKIERAKSEEAFVSKYSVVDSERENGDPGLEAYYMGIIDILQQYNGKKKVENYIMRMFAEGDAISSVSPGKYAVRFRSFISKLTT